MLHHVIQQHGRQWHRIVPLVVWALREVPNSTTGVSPYMLVYGRVPRGPLTVLRESWANNQDVQADLGKPVEKYMTDLRRRIQQAADWATLHAQHGQELYAHHHNLRSRDKHFTEGEQVIVLDDTATGKMSKRWQGLPQLFVLNHHIVISLTWVMAVCAIYMQIKCVSFTHVCKDVM